MIYSLWKLLAQSTAPYRALVFGGIEKEDSIFEFCALTYAFDDQIREIENEVQKMRSELDLEQEKNQVGNISSLNMARFAAEYQNKGLEFKENVIKKLAEKASEIYNHPLVKKNEKYKEAIERALGSVKNILENWWRCYFETFSDGCSSNAKEYRIELAVKNVTKGYRKQTELIDDINETIVSCKIEFLTFLENKLDENPSNKNSGRSICCKILAEAEREISYEKGWCCAQNLVGELENDIEMISHITRYLEKMSDNFNKMYPRQFELADHLGEFSRVSDLSRLNESEKGRLQQVLMFRCTEMKDFVDLRTKKERDEEIDAVLKSKSGLNQTNEEHATEKNDSIEGKCSESTEEKEKYEIKEETNESDAEFKEELEAIETAQASKKYKEVIDKYTKFTDQLYSSVEEDIKEILRNDPERIRSVYRSLNSILLSYRSVLKRSNYHLIHEFEKAFCQRLYETYKKLAEK